ncbi:MAG: VPLPA-CTERM sorting domain-containing protein [Phycisphaerales bacterium]
MKLITAIAVAAAVSGAASAATVKAKYSGMAQNTGSYHISLAHTSGTYNAHVGAGALKHQFQGDSEIFAGQMLRTFCVDLTQQVVGQVRTYEVISVANAPDPDAPTGNVGALRAGYLGSLYYNAMQAGLIDHRGSATDAMTNQQASAFQLVIWELAFEDAGVLAAVSGNNSGFGSLFANDDFKVTNSINGGVAANFDTFFGWAFNGDAVGGLRAMASQTAQDQLIIVPLPTGGGMALAGLAAIGCTRRRR